MTSATPEEQAKGLVTLFLDDRLENANEPPGLREAIIDRLAGQLDDIGNASRNRSTICGHRRPSGSRTRTSQTNKPPRTKCRPALPASGPRER